MGTGAGRQAPRWRPPPCTTPARHERRARWSRSSSSSCIVAGPGAGRLDGAVRLRRGGAGNRVACPGTIRSSGLRRGDRSGARGRRRMRRAAVGESDDRTVGGSSPSPGAAGDRRRCRADLAGCRDRSMCARLDDGARRACVRTAAAVGAMAMCAVRQWRFSPGRRAREQRWSSLRQVPQCSSIRPWLATTSSGRSRSLRPQWSSASRSRGRSSA